MLALVITLTTLFPRYFGGLMVLRQRDHFHLILGFAAGAILGVAVFETVPEGLRLLGEHAVPTPAGIGIVLAGIIVFALLERPAFGHLHDEDAACKPSAGHIGAGGITLHAFLDGVAIGAAFQVSGRLGVVVSAAVLVHAFSDGLNTVAVVLRHGHSDRKALAWLGADALAPVLGASTVLVVTIPAVVVGALLAFFAGMFLYLGAGSLLPSAHRSGHDVRLVIASTVAGFLLLAVVSQLLTL